MSDPSPAVARFLQESFLEVERCLVGDQRCGADDCPVCIYLSMPRL